MRILAGIALVLVLLEPLAAQAAAPGSFKDLAAQVVSILDNGTAVLIVLGLVAYFWGIASNMFGHEGHADYSKLRNNILWGLFIIFVMVSIWGIVELLQTTLFNGQVGVGGSGNAPCGTFNGCNVIQ